MTRIAPMKPYAFTTMLARIGHEWRTKDAVFDLPPARWWRAAADVDLNSTFLGRPIGTPVGPAAGPHTQMAQNLVIGWLAGARLFELKTVQVADELTLNRPCIDMGSLGLNAEWSQELHVDEALAEYVRGWMAIHLLREWEPLQSVLGDRAEPFVCNMSLGYDLRGITSPKVASFIDAMRDARLHIDRLRSEIPPPFASLSDVDVASCVSDTVTLSTFHGCPPNEIAAITRHLMERHDVDVILKLNPTLLGYKQVNELIHGGLALDDVKLVPEAFRDDLGFDRAAEVIDELRDFACRSGRRFGVKLTNTLVVENQASDIREDLVFLSGAPLHVLATALFDELLNTLPGVFAVGGHEGDVEVSFSGGVDAGNLSDTLGMGAESATMCSELLRPGGYGRIAPMLRALESSMRGAGTQDLGAWRRRARIEARSAGFRGPVEAHLHASLADVTSIANRPSSGAVVQVARELQMFGCVDCNVCVTVCPNDAMFRVATPAGTDVPSGHQYLVLAELCNDCGNCLTFCPETGDPSVVKPRLFLDRSRYELASPQAFFIGNLGGELAVIGHERWYETTRIVQQILDEEGALPIPLEQLSTL